MRWFAAEGPCFFQAELCRKAPPNMSSACTDPSNRSQYGEQLQCEVDLTRCGDIQVILILPKFSTVIRVTGKWTLNSQYELF